VVNKNGEILTSLVTYFCIISEAIYLETLRARQKLRMLQCRDICLVGTKRGKK